MLDLARIEDIELLEYVKEDEGFRPFPYYDKDPNLKKGFNQLLCSSEYTGKLTVGYGHNLDEPMSKDLAERILIHDLECAEKIVDSIFPREFINSFLSRRRRNVLIAMAYNMGNKVRTFKRMITALKKGDCEGAAREMIWSKWYSDVGANRVENLATIMVDG